MQKKILKTTLLVIGLTIGSISVSSACRGTIEVSMADRNQAVQNFYNNCPSGSVMTINVIETAEIIVLNKK